MSKNLIGTILLSQYRVDSFIASGGMGAVYKVWDLKRNVPLAMKVLQNDLVDDPSAYKYFQREARALQRLTHPNIVPFYGLFQTDELAFILQQFIDGPDLRDILRKNPNGISIKNAMMYIKALCSALGYSHANGVVHCDIKPGNVMISSGGQIYLADFGIARHAQSTTTTIAGAGTPAYMAPEQIRGGQVIPATDVYELGVLSFELLTGRRPFRGDEPESLAGGNTSGERIRYAHLNLQPANPSTIKLSIPQALSAVILKALAKAPQDRYTDAQSFYLAACLAIGQDANNTPDHLPPSVTLGGQPTLTRTPGPKSPSPKPKNTNLSGKYAILAVGSIIFLAGIFLFVQISGGIKPRITLEPPTIFVPQDPTDSSPFVSPQEPTSADDPTDVPTIADIPAIDTPIPTTTDLPTDTPIPPAPAVNGNYDLAFASDKDNGFGNMRAFIMDSNNPQNNKFFENPPRYERTQWSTFCGQWLAIEAFDIDEKSDNNTWIYLLAEGQQPIRWKHPKPADTLGVPRCSPDGRYLSYSVAKGGYYDLVVVKLDNGEIVYAPNARSYGRVAGYASWIDSTSFIFSVYISGGTAVLQTNSFGAPVALNTDLQGTHAAISPDGTKIAFSCDNGHLCVLDRSTNDLEKLLQTSWDVKATNWVTKVTPVWSRDGQWIYFESVEGGDWDIFRIRPDGTEKENLTIDWPSNEIMPATR